MRITGVVGRMLGPLPPAADQRRWMLAHSAGLLLVALWVIYVALSLWTSPVVASGAAVKAAAGTGRITDVDRVAALPPRLSFSPMFLFQQDNSTDGTGKYLVWSATNGHRYYTEVNTVPGPFPPADRAMTGAMYSGDGSKPTAEDRATAYVADRTMVGGVVVWTDAAKLALLLAAVASLIARTPQRGTRWFWFWVITIPLGVGLLWYAIREQLQDHDPSVRRWKGAQGVIFSLLGLAVLSGTATVAGQLFIRI